MSCRYIDITEGNKKIQEALFILTMDSHVISIKSKEFFLVGSSNLNNVLSYFNKNYNKRLAKNYQWLRASLRGSLH